MNEIYVLFDVGRQELIYAWAQSGSFPDDGEVRDAIKRANPLASVEVKPLSRGGLFTRYLVEISEGGGKSERQAIFTVHRVASAASRSGASV